MLPRIKKGCGQGSSWSFHESVHFPWALWSTSPIYAVVSEDNTESYHEKQKGKRGRSERREKVVDSHKSPGSPSGGLEGVATMGRCNNNGHLPPLSASVIEAWQSVIRAQIHNLFGDGTLFASGS